MSEGKTARSARIARVSIPSLIEGYLHRRNDVAQA
jgi:hypothetical protein